MFGFPETSHNVFKKNFLRTIIFDFQFASDISLKEKKGELINFFSPFFPILEEAKPSGFSVKFSDKNSTPIIENNMSSDDNILLNFKSQNNNRILSVEKHSLKLIIAGSDYSSFSNMVSLLEVIKKVLSGVFLVEVLNFNLRKLNVVEIDLKGDTSGEPAVNLFNEFINISDISFPKKNLLLNNMTTFQMKNIEFKSQLLVRYGVNSPQNIPGHLNHLLIDIDIHLNELKVDDQIQSIKKVNDEAYNVYNWIISDKFRQILNMA